jgi:hypothetical protein
MSDWYDTKTGKAVQAFGKGIVTGAVVGATAAAAVAAAPVVGTVLVVGGTALAAIDVANNYQARRIEQIAAGTSTAHAGALALGDTTGVANIVEGALNTNLATGRDLSEAQASSRLNQGAERVGMAVGAAAGAAVTSRVIADIKASPHPERGAFPAGKGNPRGSRRPSPALRDKIFEKGKDAGGVPRCEYCGDEITRAPRQTNSYEADHRTAWSRGGATVEENLGSACRTCNREKSVMSAEEYRALLAQRAVDGTTPEQ